MTHYAIYGIYPDFFCIINTFPVISKKYMPCMAYICVFLLRQKLPAMYDNSNKCKGLGRQSTWLAWILKK
jgi:hypothetical protein